jgi:hypothetical protein
MNRQTLQLGCTPQNFLLIFHFENARLKASMSFKSGC